MYEEKLQLSGIQHFSFCQRQWALIHLEKQWAENVRTVEGSIMHQRAHDSTKRERRGNTLILRDLSIYSNELGLSGKSDVIEFLLDENGITIQGEEGLWKPYPIEYKKGKPKIGDEDKLQLCAQAMCLEEMLCCSINEGALYYGEPKRRLVVEFDDYLRKEVIRLSDEMHKLYDREYTPKSKIKKSCNACSLKELCVPKLSKQKTVLEYLNKYLNEEEG